MTESTSWQVLYVDDDMELLEQVESALNGKVADKNQPDIRISLQTESDFTKALEKIEAHRFDLVILDVRVDTQGLQEDAGVSTLQEIQRRKFVPVIFYTGIPNRVIEYETPLIKIVEKTEGFRRLIEVIQELFATRLPIVNRALIRHLESVQRDYMWRFVAENWEKLGETNDRTSLAYLLARRLAVSLSGPGIDQLAKDLGDDTGLSNVSGRVHPMQYYLIPPVESCPLAGDIYFGTIDEHSGYWTLLTPSCDMQVRSKKDGTQIPAKAERVLLAACIPLEDEKEYRDWRDQHPNPPARVTKDLERLLMNNRNDAQAERFSILPGAVFLPTLIVDFQQLYTVSWKELETLGRLASLDSPYAEAMLTRFTRYFGRLGTPDLDTNILIQKLQSEIVKKE